MAGKQGAARKAQARARVPKMRSKAQYMGPPHERFCVHVQQGGHVDSGAGRRCQPSTGTNVDFVLRWRNGMGQHTQFQSSVAGYNASHSVSRADAARWTARHPPHGDRVFAVVQHSTGLLCEMSASKIMCRLQHGTLDCGEPRGVMG